MQLFEFHFRKTKAEYVERLDIVWGGKYPFDSGGDFDEMVRRNEKGNECPIFPPTYSRMSERVLDRMVRQEEVDFSKRGCGGSYCFGGECRPRFLTVCAHTVGEGHYINEWVRWHLAIGADFVLLYIDTRTDLGKVELSERRKEFAEYVKVGLVQVEAMVADRHVKTDAMERFVDQTWWFSWQDTDAFLVSPLDGPVVDFLASVTGGASFPEQYVVARFDVGDSGHIAAPQDFLARAYTRSNALPPVFHSILYGPAWTEKRLDSGNPHMFHKDYRSCGGLYRVGPLLWCPRDALLPYFVGWPGHGVERLGFTPSEDCVRRGAAADRAETLQSLGSELRGRFWSGIAHVVICLIFGCLAEAARQRIIVGRRDLGYDAVSQKEHDSDSSWAVPSVIGRSLPKGAKWLE